MPDSGPGTAGGRASGVADAAGRRATVGPSELAPFSVAAIMLLPHRALLLVPVVYAIAPRLQRLSQNQLSTLNHVVVGRQPVPRQ